MSEQPKKVRTAAQAAQNALLKDASAWLGSKGLPKQVQYISIVKKGKAAGMSSPEIEAEVRKRVNENTGKKAEKKAAPKATAVAAPKAAGPNAGTRNNKPKNNNASTKKVRTAAQLAANAKMKEMKAKFNEKGIKYGSNSMKYYKEQKVAGRSEEEVLAEMPAKFPKYTINESGAKKAVVAKRAVTMKKAANNGANVVAPAVVRNAGVAKGQYVCDRCRLVANNTRKNNKPKNYTNMNNNAFYYQ
jgi:hypothetical protein